MLAKLISAIIVGGARFITGAHARWQGCRPEARQRIFVANHTSHLDFILLWSSLPASLRAHTRPVAATDYWQRGMLRRYLATQIFKAVLVDRGGLQRDPHSANPLLDALECGDSLILFPEGTRGSGDELLPFKAGIFHIARAMRDVQVVPVWMDNPVRVMPKGSLLLVPMLCSATFGAPVDVACGETKDVYLERLRQSVQELSAI